MDANNKYKKWGWGAVIGLIGVILVSGLVVAVTMSSPKKSTTADTTTDNTPISVVDTDRNDNDDSKKEGNTGRDNEADKKNTEDNSGTTDTDKKTDNTGTGTGTSNTDSSKKSGGSSSMPKTGPEDNLASVAGLAVAAGLASYLVIMKQRA